MMYQVIALVKIDFFQFSFLLLVCGGGGGVGSCGGICGSCQSVVSSGSSLAHVGETLASFFLCSILWLLAATVVS